MPLLFLFVSSSFLCEGILTEVIRGHDRPYMSSAFPKEKKKKISSSDLVPTFMCHLKKQRQSIHTSSGPSYKDQVRKRIQDYSDLFFLLLLVERWFFFFFFSLTMFLSEPSRNTCILQCLSVWPNLEMHRYWTTRHNNEPPDQENQRNSVYSLYFVVFNGNKKK